MGLFDSLYDVGNVATLGFLDAATKDPTTTSSRNIAPEGADERLGREGASSAYRTLQDFIDAGPGRSDVAGAYASNDSLAALLESYSTNGNLPTADDMYRGQSFATAAFAPQRELLKQSFEDQTNKYNQQAALMGRTPNDSVLAAKLGYYQARETNVLGAQQNAFANNYAMAQPGERLSYAQQANQMRNSLATQAMQNRQALLSLGSSIQSQGQNFRLKASTEQSNIHDPGRFFSAVVGVAGAGQSFAATRQQPAQSGAGSYGGGAEYGAGSAPGANTMMMA